MNKLGYIIIQKSIYTDLSVLDNNTNQGKTANLRTSHELQNLLSKMLKILPERDKWFLSET